MFDLLFLLLLFLAGLLFLFIGYKRGGELFNRSFNCIGGVKNTGVVGEASVLCMLVLISLVLDIFSRNCCKIGIREILEQKSFWLMAISLAILIVSYCLSLGPKEVFKKRLKDRDARNILCKKNSCNLRVGYFIYSWYGVIACAGFSLLSVFLFTKLLNYDSVSLKATFGDLDNIALSVSSQSGDILLQCEVISGEVLKGLSLLRAITDRYLVIASLVCFLFLFIAATNIWKVYTEKALQISKLVMWIVFLILVPIILILSYVWYTNYIEIARNSLEVASKILMQTGTADQFSKLNELRKINMNYLSMWGFVGFIFGGGGLIAVLLNAFIILFGSLLKKGDMAEIFIPSKWLANIVKALLKKEPDVSHVTKNKENVENTGVRFELKKM